jgi:photosystem II stability/assembly factor-like uncharacterized protein
MPPHLRIFLVHISTLALLGVWSCDDDSDCPPAAPCLPPTPEGWFQQTSPTARELSTVHAIDVNTVVAVGDSGAILRTTDGGQFWDMYETGSDALLVGISFIDADTGWTSGYAGSLYKTTDGGRTWQSRDPGTTADLADVSFVNSTIGWIGGGPWPEQAANGILAYTEDGGQTWVPRATPGRVVSLFVIDADTACAALSGGAFLRTTDRGRTWQEYQSNPPSWVGGLWFTDPITGWIVGAQGTILSTTDGGTTWNPINSGTTRNLVDVYFQDPDTGWAVGAFGTIVKTMDGGVSWTFRTSGTTFPLRSTSFADDDTGWIVGRGGVILKTVTARRNPGETRRSPPRTGGREIDRAPSPHHDLGKPFSFRRRLQK